MVGADMKATKQALRALSELIIPRAVLAIASEPNKEWHLFCAETLQKAQRGEIMYRKAIEEMDAKEAAI
jgi:hypothetical protein